MNTWSSPVTQHIAAFGIIGFALLMLAAVAARVVLARSRAGRAQSQVAPNTSERASEHVLGAIGGPSTYRSVKQRK